MYYDIFGNSEYLNKKKLKLGQCALAKTFEENFNTLDKKLKFLELTTSDFVKKFNEFASNQASLTDPAKHTSFLDTIVHFQFAMILVGMESAELHYHLRKKDNLERAAGLMPAQIDEATINSQIYKFTRQYYEKGVFDTLSSQYKNQADFTAQLKIQNTPLYDTLKAQAIKTLSSTRKNWRANTKPAEQFTAIMSQEIASLQPKATQINESLTRSKIFISQIRQYPNIPTFIEAKKILDTFEFITSGKLLSRTKLFGSPDPLTKRAKTPGFIDFMLASFAHAIKQDSTTLVPAPVTTLHQEQIFLTKEIETKLLSLQHSTVQRTAFPKNYPPILFAYILNLMLFTLLIKTPQRSSLLGLEIKVWNAQLRFTCHYLPNHVDTLLKEYEPGKDNIQETTLLVPYFKAHWVKDYFNHGISPEKIVPVQPPSPIPADTAPVKTPSPIPAADVATLTFTPLDHSGNNSDDDDEWDA